MSGHDKTLDRSYWPFGVIPIEDQTDQHKAEIRFLETASREGFLPYMYGGGSFGAESGPRGSLIVIRGRSRWEVVLGIGPDKVSSEMFTDFDAAAEVALKWLRSSHAPVACVPADSSQPEAAEMAIPSVGK